MNTLILTGDYIPAQLEELTLKDDGVMADWIKKDKKNLVAIVAYEKTVPIAWFGFTKADTFMGVFGRDDIKVSVFVHEDYRGKKIARDLIRQGLELIRQINSKARILYGAAEPHLYFNEIYKREILKAGLKARRYYAID